MTDKYNNFAKDKSNNFAFLNQLIPNQICLYPSTIITINGSKQMVHLISPANQNKAFFSVPLKFLRMDRYRRLDFRQKKFDLQDLKSVISCPDWHLCPRCVNCQCARCPRCKF